MSKANYIPPMLSKWKKSTECIACHSWGDDYDTVYSFFPSKNVEYRIWHEEEEYGNDTHEWQTGIEYENDGYITRLDIAFKELTAEAAFSKLKKYVESLEGKYPWTPITKAQKNAKERLYVLENKYKTYDKDTDVRVARTSEFIGCQKCGSKLKRIYLKSTYCPLCGEDLRSKTVQDTLQRYRIRIKELKKKL